METSTCQVHTLILNDSPFFICHQKDSWDEFLLRVVSMSPNRRPHLIPWRNGQMSLSSLLLLHTSCADSQMACFPTIKISQRTFGAELFGAQTLLPFGFFQQCFLTASCSRMKTCSCCWARGPSQYSGGNGIYMYILLWFGWWFLRVLETSCRVANHLECWGRYSFAWVTTFPSSMEMPKVSALRSRPQERNPPVQMDVSQGEDCGTSRWSLLGP